MPAYTGPVIDTHHHIWRRADIPWLADPPIPRMYGDYFGLRRDYPIEEFMREAGEEGVTKSVHVTANRTPARALDETRWLQETADKHGFPHGIVCQADITDPDLDSKLKAQTQFPNVRGVRQQIFWDSHPLRQRVSRPDFCNTPEFRRGVALLEKYNLSFELQVFAGQARYAVELLKACPNVPMILVHAGMLTDRSPEMIEQWRQALTAMAAFPNLTVKLSGIGMFSTGVTAPQVRQVIRDTIQIFGAERTIYGSNFPLEKLYGSYADYIGHCRTALAEYSEGEQRAVFHDNAARYYRI